MKSTWKRVMVLLLLALVLLQAYQPARNTDGGRAYTTDFTTVYPVPLAIKTMLHAACYDCHSNNTRYAWYDYIQPARLWVEAHIRDAKKELNFNEWGTYSNRKQQRLLNAIREQVEHRQMPLPAYALMHADARLSAAQVRAITGWLKEQE